MSSSYIHCVSQRWTWARGVDIHLVSSVSLIHPAINRKCRGFRSIQPSQTGIWRGEEAERIRISTFTVAIQRWSRFHRHWRGSPTARGDMLHHVRLFTISACLELIWTGRACWVINDPNKFFHSLFLFIGLRSRRERLPGRRRGLGYPLPAGGLFDWPPVTVAAFCDLSFSIKRNKQVCTQNIYIHI